VLADDMQAPLAAFGHGTDLLDVSDRNVGTGLVLAEDEVRPVLFDVLAFRGLDTAVLWIVFEVVGFERDRALWVGVAVFAVAWRVRSRVPVPSMSVPTIERLTEFSEDSLCPKSEILGISKRLRRFDRTGLRIEVLVAFVLFEVLLEVELIGNVAASLPDTLSSPSANVSELADVHESFALVSQSEPR
jgi:DNA-binding transcriptional regulator YdaS (Cro superfamily)